MKVYEINYYNWLRFGIHPNYRNMVVQTKGEAERLVKEETERLVSLTKSEGWTEVDREEAIYWDKYNGSVNGSWIEVTFEKGDETNYGRIWATELEGSEFEF